MILPSDLTHDIVREHQRWLLNNVGDTNEVDACRQYFDKRLGALRKRHSAALISNSINRRRLAEAATREAAQMEAAANGKLD